MRQFRRLASVFAVALPVLVAVQTPDVMPCRARAGRNAPATAP